MGPGQWRADRGKLIAYEQSVAQVALEDGSERLIPAKELSAQDRAHIHAQRRQARREQEKAELGDRLADPMVAERMAAAEEGARPSSTGPSSCPRCQPPTAGR